MSGQSQQHKKSRLQKAMEAYGEQISVVLEGDDTAPEELKAGDLSAKFNAFAALTDPSHEAASRHKYLDWICRVYLQRAEQGNPIKAEDLSKISSELKDFKSFSRLFDGARERDISHYESYDALLNQLRPYQQARDAKKAAKAKVTEEVEAGTIVVYDGPEGKIVRPTTKEACQFWGMGTKWCISAQKFNAFRTYYEPDEGKHVFIYLPADVSIEERRRLPQFSSFKFAGAGSGLWNELDSKIDFIPVCLAKLIKAAESSESTFEKGFLNEHGQYQNKAYIPHDPQSWDDPEVMWPVLKKTPHAIIYTDNPDIVKDAGRQFLEYIKEKAEEFRQAAAKMREEIEKLMEAGADQKSIARCMSEYTSYDHSFIRECGNFMGLLLDKWASLVEKDTALRREASEEGHLVFSASKQCHEILNREIKANMALQEKVMLYGRRLETSRVPAP